MTDRKYIDHNKNNLNRFTYVHDDDDVNENVDIHLQMV
jgi:hypothetical protein